MKVLVTAEERRAQLWDIARSRLEELFPDHGSIGPTPPPTLHENDWKDIERLLDRLAAQDASTSGRRRMWSAQQLDLGKAEEAQLKEDAERLAKRLGVREKIVDPAQGLVATMVAQSKGEKRQRTQVRGKSGSGKSRQRNLLHLGSLIQRRDGEKSLGPKKTTLPRPTGAQVGFAIVS